VVFRSADLRFGAVSFDLQVLAGSETGPPAAEGEVHDVARLGTTESDAECGTRNAKPSDTPRLNRLE